MKCPKCNGMGTSNTCVNGTFKSCSFCNGTGEVFKCPKCGELASLSNWGSYVDPDYADFHVECEKCGYHSMGSTDPQKAKEMFGNGMGMYYTNEQWFCLLSTEEKAKVIVNIHNLANIDQIEWWLKEIHK